MRGRFILAMVFSTAVALSPLAAGPVFAPGTRLFVVETEHFDIVFPERSRPSALYLSTVAESVYREVSGKLEASLPSRIPVLITPDTDVFNGYTNPFPYMHIVLYDTSLDIGWTAFQDNFRYLFLHELTHAVSLQIKAPWASFLSGVFGSWVLPGLLNSPEFMVEGVAVSFESADGHTGRANDPLVKERLRQDITENRFKSPIEASATYDEYPYGTIYYEYGGLFSAYIQRTYGMGEYAKLWKAMGDLILPTSLDPYEVSFYKAFRRTYGMPFTEAWADFRNAIAFPGSVARPEVLGPREPAAIPGGLAGNDGSLFWVDARANRAMRTDARTLESSVLFDAGSSWAITDASSDAGPGTGRILVSRAVPLPDGRAKAETLVYDLASRRFLPGSAVADMREARFFRDGLVGIVSNLHDTDLVLVSGSGSRVLLPGSEGVMYSSPAVLDDSRIALIVAIGGERTVGMLDVGTGKLELLRPRGKDARLFSYVRQLSASRQGTLYFNYDSDDGFYKLGILDGDSLRIEGTDYSGGVFWPRSAAGRVFYVGRFSGGEKLCRYPALDGREAASDPIAFDLAAFDPWSALAARDAGIAAAAAATPVRSYHPLAYADPFRMWALYPDLGTLGRSLRVFGISYLQDPPADNTVLLDAGYDSAYPFADASLVWANDALPVSLATSLGDNLVYGASGPPERQSSARLSATLALPASPYPREATLGLGGSLFFRAQGQGGSPYSWPFSGWNSTASAVLGWQGELPGAANGTTRGFSATSYHDLDIASLAYKTEARLAGAYDRVPLRLELWGAWATTRTLRLDSASSVFASDHRPAYVEYETSKTMATDLLVEGSLAYRLADQAIHANLLDLYFNRLLLDIGLRGAYLSEQAFGSTFVRLSFDIAGAQGMAFGGARIFAEGFARLDGEAIESAIGFQLGYQLSLGSLPGGRE